MPFAGVLLNLWLKTMKYDIFISYKRDGGAEKAELLRSELIRRGYRRSRIFMDTYSLGEGRISDNLELAIRNSDNIIVAITKGCFDGISEDGNWLREISLAMSLGKRIIPVYFDGIQEINPQDLPECIKDFPKENAVLYVHQYAKASFDYLCSFLKRRSIRIPRWGKITAGVVVLAAAIVLAIALFPVRSNLRDGEVYILETSASKCYHMDKNCWALRNSKKKLKIVTLEEAEAMGKYPCSKCVR